MCALCLQCTNSISILKGNTHKPYTVSRAPLLFCRRCTAARAWAVSWLLLSSSTCNELNDEMASGKAVSWLLLRYSCFNELNDEMASGTAVSWLLLSARMVILGRCRLNSLLADGVSMALNSASVTPQSLRSTTTSPRLSR